MNCSFFRNGFVYIYTHIYFFLNVILYYFFLISELLLDVLKVVVLESFSRVRLFQSMTAPLCWCVRIASSRSDFFFFMYFSSKLIKEKEIIYLNITVKNLKDKAYNTNVKINFTQNINFVNVEVGTLSLLSLRYLTLRTEAKRVILWLQFFSQIQRRPL